MLICAGFSALHNIKSGLKMKAVYPVRKRMTDILLFLWKEMDQYYSE